ncbi:aminopeptidase [Plasticicumulans sp.]|uniref:aminopeptidase n=1 Tax=Plasticicumulans sp. TaxID=2307179 RepID=UPI00396474E3
MRRRCGLLAACVVIVVAALAAGGGCETVAFYSQAAHGQFEMLAARRDFAAVANDPQTAPDLRTRLNEIADLRRFAVDVLHLPDDGAYTRYAALQRPAAVWTVVATPPLSLAPRLHCFPIAGCVPYRGWFEAEAADAEAGRLRAAGDDVSLGAVPAYSSLGWFDDPVLDTFVQWPLGRLAELICHELAHRKLYLAGDAAFNEAYATAVGRLGAEAWLRARARGRSDELAAWQAERALQAELRSVLLATRSELATLYDGPLPEAGKRAAKARILAAAQARYVAVLAARGIAAARPPELNNARLAMLATYEDAVPAFEALFHAGGDDWSAFHAAAAELATLPPAQRRARLGLPAPEGIATASPDQAR